jgi:hypothetical protein
MSKLLSTAALLEETPHLYGFTRQRIPTITAMNTKLLNMTALLDQT